MNDDRDPLQILAETADPAVAARAMNKLAGAGFTDVPAIARSFGWHIDEENERAA